MEDWFSIEWFGYDTFRNYYWEYPYFLFALPLIPVFFWLRNALHRKRKQKLVMTYSRASGPWEWLTLLRYLQPVTAALGIAMVLIALARPQVISERTDQYSEGIDIMLLMDISDSMMEKDLSPNRLASAKSIASKFIKGRLQDRIGLVIFAGEAVSLCPLTTDYDLLGRFLDEIQPDMIPIPGTAIGSALAVAVNRMRETSGASKVAILISDGDNTSGSLGPTTAAQLAEAYRIRVYTIAVGLPKSPTKADTLLRRSALVDEGELQKIAAIGDGKFFRATDNNALASVFEQIDQLEKIKTKDVVSRDTKDFYRIYLYWAITLLLISFGTKCTFMANILED
ncbi:Ca-activated chloride channel family protein [Dyadobacter jejuensis]|uniref:Ca-activated chloride channel family protein n=1 Tax=Dyadobacter jejuensis TaxID=1082580 RepID=A0A316ACB8_9BACT|nr:VWA domain-containing protein [Dyadobacter jejuensis]PWJ55271.1 Ca-activated chloride channel family protein [Dyadobacter jejuensis]